MDSIDISSLFTQRQNIGNYIMIGKEEKDKKKDGQKEEKTENKNKNKNKKERNIRVSKEYICQNIYIPLIFLTYISWLIGVTGNPKTPFSIATTLRC